MTNKEELIRKISAKFTKNGGELWMSKIDHGLCIRSSQTIQRGVKTLCILNHWGPLHKSLPIQERLLRIIEYPHRVPRTHRQETRIQNTCLAR